MFDELPFPHHTFLGPPDAGRFRIIRSADAGPARDPTADDVAGVAEKLRSAGVTEIVLVHGTFAGNDFIGLMRELSRFSPRTSSVIKELGKQWFDQLSGEVGNYTTGYGHCLAELINVDQPSNIAVTHCHWSGENHHLGRACGAISLLDTLFDRSWNDGDRLLLLAHSHGGNLLAMVTLLLGCSRRSLDVFFRSMRSYYDAASTAPGERQKWAHVRSRLTGPEGRSRLPRLDIATFGTPLRYRWNTRVCESLMHFIQHRSLIDNEPARSSLPASVGDLTSARGGDYVQHLGIGGTDFPHSILAWRVWRTERRLRRIFEPTVRVRDLKKHLECGHRVPIDGVTRLIDYAATPEQWHQKLLGHGVYTLRQWLPFHLREIVNEFYS